MQYERTNMGEVAMWGKDGRMRIKLQWRKHAVIIYGISSNDARAIQCSIVL
jgi:hypothetical protein